MTLVLRPQLSQDIAELVARANAHFAALSPSQKLRHRYMQRRSFARGMCSSSTPYETHCAGVDARMPHEAGLSDVEIGLILVGESHK